MSSSAAILIVDDEPQLRWNLRAFLEDLGFHVLEASNGQEGLECCERADPDLILLDISMPGMDGFEVCRCIRKSSACQDKPIIFISALLDASEKVRAFRSGGVDYITKPFQFEEVEARVNTHLEIYRQRRLLQQQHEELARLEKVRDSLTHMAAHDMRSPVAIICMALDLISMKVNEHLPDLGSTLNAAKANTQLLAELITQMLDVSRLESGAMPLNLKCLDLAVIAQESMAFAKQLSSGQSLLLLVEEPLLVRCDHDILARVFMNLLGNALKFTPKEGRIQIRLSRDGQFVRVDISDNGAGISKDNLGRIFDKFAQTPEGARQKGAGLGLAFCKLAVEAHQGQIGAESEPGAGSNFWFKLPLS